MSRRENELWQNMLLGKNLVTLQQIHKSAVESNGLSAKNIVTHFLHLWKWRFFQKNYTFRGENQTSNTSLCIEHEIKHVYWSVDCHLLHK